MEDNAAQMSQQMPIPVGFQYRGVTGKEWVVTGIRPGGVCEIAQIGRMVFGERYSKDIRADVAEGRAAPTETSDEARAILRRLNGRD